MNNSIGDIGPGSAYGIGAQYTLKKELDFVATYVRYLAKYGFGGAAYDISGPY